MTKYSFTSIKINSRSVEISHIRSSLTTPSSEFEQHTFAFIKDWLNGETKFELDTSGSTGSPKKIIITRNQMIQSALITINALNLNYGDIALVCLNTKYIAGKMMVVRALEANMKIIATEPAINPLVNIGQQFDFTAFVPLQLQAIIDSDLRNKLNYAKAIIVGGATVSHALQKEIEKINSPIYATYGMTETISHIALQRLNGRSPESFFKSLPGIQIQTDNRGCLIIEAPYLDDRIYTNDLVKLVSPDKFMWLGRWDNIINTGGVKVIPEEIEIAIQQIISDKEKRNFLVSGIPDPHLGERIIVIVEGEEKKIWVEILSILKQSISKYAVPKEILHVKKFIYTNNGKIDRNATKLIAMAQYFT